MQITAELDNQHLEKLHALEKALRKNTSELISLAIDEIYQRQMPVALNEGQKAYQIMQQTGFIGSMAGDGYLSENYKDALDWQIRWQIRGQANTNKGSQIRGQVQFLSQGGFMFSQKCNLTRIALRGMALT